MRRRIIPLLVGGLAVAGALATAGPAYAASDYSIVNVAAGLCMQPEGASGSSGAPVVLDYGPCDPANHSMSWRAVNSVKINNLTYYQYQNVHSGFCLGVSGGSSAGGAQLVQ